jgi:hypothetical protein
MHIVQALFDGGRVSRVVLSAANSLRLMKPSSASGSAIMRRDPGSRRGTCRHAGGTEYPHTSFNLRLEVGRAIKRVSGGNGPCCPIEKRILPHQISPLCSGGRVQSHQISPLCLRGFRCRYVSRGFVFRLPVREDYEANTCCHTRFFSQN